MGQCPRGCPGACLAHCLFFRTRLVITTQEGGKTSHRTWFSSPQDEALALGTPGSRRSRCPFPWGQLTNENATT